MTPKESIMIKFVSDLVNPIDGNWDEELINEFLWPVDAHRILQIPLTPGREDFVAWHNNWLGLFTFKSAYYCQWNYKFCRHGRNVDITEGASNLVWKRLWKLDIPSKIKIFGWHVLHGMIPCREILANRHVGNQSGCPMCMARCEDIKHMLFSCERAKEVWRCLQVQDRIKEILETDRVRLWWRRLLEEEVSSLLLIM
jgi:hypothetical protein